MNLRHILYKWVKSNLSYCYNIAIFLTLGVGTISADFKIRNGKIINQNSGNIEFDLKNDGTSGIVMTKEGKVGIGVVNPVSTLELKGTFGLNSQIISGNATIGANSMVLADSSGGNITLTLPSASSLSGRIYTVKKISNANEVLLSGGGSYIDSVLSFTFSSNHLGSIQVISNGTQWLILSISTMLTASSWTPADITTAAWYDANDASTVLAGSSDNVYQWNDKSGNSRNATREYSGNQMTYVASDSMMGGKPSIGNVGATAYSEQKGLLTPSFTFKNIYVVCYHDDGTDTTFLNDYQCLISGNNAGNNSAERAMGWFGQSGWLTGGGSVFDGGGAYRDGSTTATTSGVLPMPACQLKFKHGTDVTQPSALGYWQVSNITRAWNGSFSEWIFTDGTESLAIEQKIEGYLAHKWGTTSSLPNDHPYKSVAP